MLFDILKTEFGKFLKKREFNDEFSRLKSILYIFVLAVIIVCSLLTYTSFSMNLKNNLGYWSKLRILGLTKRKMFQIMIVENILFSLLGSMVGYFIGIFAAYIVCLLTRTDVSTVFTDITSGLLIIGLGCVSSVIPSMSILATKLNISPLEIIKNNIKRKKRINSLWLLL